MPTNRTTTTSTTMPTKTTLATNTTMATKNNYDYDYDDDDDEDDDDDDHSDDGHDDDDDDSDTCQLSVCRDGLSLSGSWNRSYEEILSLAVDRSNCSIQLVRELQ